MVKSVLGSEYGKSPIVAALVHFNGRTSGDILKWKNAIVIFKDGTKVSILLCAYDSAKDLKKSVDLLVGYVKDIKTTKKRKK